MQYKKDEVRKRLIEAGEEEFFEFGFQGSSVRRIVKSAGTTIGNFYNYFPNKEGLFLEVVSGELERFDKFLGSHEESGDEDYLRNISDAAEWYGILDDTADIFMPVFTRKFHILVAGSEGTSLEGSRKKVLEYIRIHFLEHLSEYKTVIKEAEGTSQTLAYEFLEGILYSIKKYYGTAAFSDIIKNQLMFFLMGTMGMLRGRGEDRTDD